MIGPIIMGIKFIFSCAYAVEYVAFKTRLGVTVYGSNDLLFIVVHRKSPYRTRFS